MANNKNIFYHQHQILTVSKVLTAEIDLKIKEGVDLALYIDQEAYKNFTITEDGITGDLIDAGTAAFSALMRYQEPVRQTAALGSNFNPRSDYNQDSFKVAIYITDVTTETTISTSYPVILFYREDNDTFLTTYFNASSQYITNQKLDENTKIDQINLANGSISHLDWTLANATGSSLGSINNNWVTNGYAAALTYASNIPIFNNEANAKAYLRDSSVLTGLLNKGDKDPEKAYKDQFDFWYIKSVYGHNTRNTLSNSNEVNYLRFYPKEEGIAFVMHEPTKTDPYTWELVNYGGYEAQRAPRGAVADDEYSITEDIPWKYLDRSISFGSDDYYSCFEWETNIPTWETQQDADDYFNGLKDISEALNFDNISRLDNSIVDPNFIGTDKDEETSLGTNGMQYGYGCRLYAISNIELASLFNELFDPLNLEDILDGQKIFGSDGITQSIAGILYLPLSDLSDICGLGSLSYIKIGSWQSQNAQGRRINNNSGIIDVGSFTWTPTYNDFRDFEPYTMAFIETGFWGFHELQISKYYNKTVSCKVAIDCATGATSLMLFGDGILLDCFEGTCGASRPFVATDNNAYMNNIISAVTGASNGASAGINNVGAAVADAGKLSTAGGAVGAAATGIGAVGVAGGIAASGIYAGYNIKNAVDSPPQISRGNLSGNLGYYANNKISFIIAQKRTIVPENREAVIGLPSGHGATVGSFAGFLSCSAFKLADGFTGTDEERAEIMEIMRGGIYL